MINKRKLKNYLIKKDVQLKLIFTNLLYMFFITLITIATILFPIISLMYQPSDLEIKYQVSTFYIMIFERLPLVCVIIFILFCIHQILIAHRFLGPLTNFSNTVRKITEGDLTRKVHLRRYDFFKEDEKLINQMIDTLSRTLGNIKKEHHTLLAALNQKDLHNAVKQAQLVSEHLSVFTLADPDKDKPNA